jgi:hypothetical protein
MLEPFFRRHDIKKNDILQNDTSFGSIKIYKPRPPFFAEQCSSECLYAECRGTLSQLEIEMAKKCFLGP